MLTHSTSCNLTQRLNLIENQIGGCLAWDVSPVAPTPFGFLPLFFFFLFLCVCVCVCVCVLYYKFLLYITRGAPNKAVKKIKE